MEDIEAQKVTIEVECVCGTTWGTEEELLSVHGYEERRWRHLDTMQFETIIQARVPRVRHRARGDSRSHVAEIRAGNRISPLR